MGADLAYAEPPEGDVIVEYENELREAVIVTFRPSPGGKPLAGAALRVPAAAFGGGRKDGAGRRALFERREARLGSAAGGHSTMVPSATIEGADLFGQGTTGLELGFYPRGGEWYPSLHLTVGRRTLAFNDAADPDAIGLAKFIAGASSKDATGPKPSLKAAINGADASWVAAALFGERLRVIGDGRGVDTLKVDADGVFTLDLDPDDPSSGRRFAALRGSVAFRTLRFGFLSSAVAAAFAVPPSPDDAIRPAAPGAGVPPARPRDVRDLFPPEDEDEEQDAARASWAGPDDAGTLYGLAAGAASSPRPFDAGKALGFALLASMPADGCTAMGFRRREGASLAQSVAEGAMSLSIACSNGGQSTSVGLDGLFGRIRRGLREGTRTRPRDLWTLASFIAATSPTTLATSHGPFLVASLPPHKARPDARSRHPPIAIEAREESIAPRETRTLTLFAAPLAMSAASIALPEDDGGDGAELTSQLLFDESECLFRLPGIPTVKGAKALRKDLLSAEAIVDLGLPAVGGEPFADPPVRLSLGNATLKVTRPRDLLSLSFEFRNLVLEADGGRSRIVPDQRLASCTDRMAPRDGADLGERRASRRRAEPLLIVEFPPQHVAEQTFFVQDAAPPMLPPPPAPVSLADAQAIIKGMPAERLAKRRAALFALIAKEAGGKAPAPAGPDQVEPFLAGYCLPAAGADCGADRPFARFASAYFRRAAGPASGLRREQRLYLGPAFLDPDAMLLAIDVAGAPPPKPPLPYPTIPSETDSDGAPLGASFPSFVVRYSDWLASSAPAALRGALPDPYPGGAEMAQWLAARDPSKPGAKAAGGTLGPEAIAGLLAAWAGLASDLPKDAGVEPGGDGAPIEARLSGPSRLVFRVPCDDYAGGRPDADGMPPGGFPFALGALTNWGAFDLAVVRRAEKLFERDEGGRASPRWDRVEALNDAERLMQQGISRGDVASRRAAEGRLDGASARGLASGARRMADVFASLKDAPEREETSIELPFRLHLSPAQDALWRTPLAMPAAFRPAPGRPTPLWAASLDEDEKAPGLRAVWSPDFRPAAFLGASDAAPMGGPFAPWAAPRDSSSRRPAPDLPRFRTPIDAADRHELVALSSAWGLPVRGRRLDTGALSSDGSQIEPPPGFALSDAVDGLGNPDGTGAIYVPKPLQARELTLTALGGTIDLDTAFTPPAAAKVARSGVPTNLFDAFNVERWRHKAVLGRDVAVEVVYKGFLFPFGHRAALVKITERRFVAHGGRRGAYLLQRKFLRVGKPLKDFAAVGQANAGHRWPPRLMEMLTRVTPDIVDPDEDGSFVPATPVPAAEAPSGLVRLQAPGAPPNTFLPGQAFWPRTDRRPGAEVRFEVQIDGMGGAVSVPLLFVNNTAANDAGTMRALCEYYSGISRAGDGRCVMDHKGLKRRYAAETTPGECSHATQTWRVEAEGSERTAYAEQGAGLWGQPDNTLFDFSALLQGNDQPPFFPVMAEAQIRLEQIDRLVGTSVGPVTVAFDSEYVARGFDTKGVADGSGKNDVYLKLKSAVRMDTGRSGDRTGGAARPDASYVAVSRGRGPLGSQKLQGAIEKPGRATDPQPSAASFFTPAALKQPDASDFFSGSAKILGILTFGEAIKLVTEALGALPALRETIHYASDLVSDAEQSVEQMRGLLRERVLRPCLTAIETLEAQWADALGGTKLSPAALYPTIWKALEDLRSALQAAIGGGAAGEADLSDLFKELGDVYGAGRRFVTAIERVAADPITPVRETLRDAFTQSVSSLTGIDPQVLASIRAALGDRASLEKAVRTVLADDALAGWRRLAFAVPVARQGAMYDEVNTVAEEALRGAILDGAWIAAGTIDAKALTDAFAQRFAKDAAAADAATRQAMQDALADWSASARKKAAAIEGAAFERLRAALQTLLDGIARLEDMGTTLEAARDALLTGADRLLRGYLEIALGKAEDALPAGLCGRVLAPALDLIDSVVPATAVPPGTDCATLQAPACTTAAALKADDGAPVNPAEACRAAFVLLCDLDDLAAKADAAVPALPGAVAQAARDLHRDLAKAFEPLANAIAAVDGLGTAYRAARPKLISACTAGTGGLAADVQRALGIAASLQRTRARLLMALKAAASALGDAAVRLAQIKAAVPPDAAGQLTVAGLALASCVRGTAATGWALLRLASDATLLVTALGPPGDARRAAYAALGADLAALTAPPAVAKLAGDVATARADATDAANALAAEVAAARTLLADLGNRTGTDDAALAADAQAVEKALTDPSGFLALTGPVSERLAAAEVKMAESLASGLAVSDATLATILGEATAAIKPVIGAAAALYTQARSSRDAFYAKYLSGDVAGDDPQVLLAKVGLRSIAQRFLVARPTAASPDRPTIAGEAAAPTRPADDFLTAESTELAGVQADLAAGKLTPDKAKPLAALLRDWAAGRSALQLLATQIVDAGGELMRGSIVKLVDFNAARRVIEDQLKAMIPAEAVLTFDLAGALQPISVFQPDPGSAIAVSAVTRVNLLDLGKGPSVSVNGSLGPFAIDLFEIVTLSFSGATFVSGSNRGSDFKLSYRDVQLGERVAFLKDISSYLQPRDGSGPYVTPLAGRPGIEAGYGLALGVISIGTVSFINVSLNAACRLPFDDSAALFTASIGRRDAPFLISAAPYGGGGFFGLVASGSSIVAFEASFEFGGVGAFHFGPLEGQGRITLGIYVKQQLTDGEGGKGTTIEGFFYCGGSAHLACFSISASLSVRIRQVPGGAMQGMATFSFSFSIGIADIHYEVTVTKSEGSGFKSSALAGPTRYASLAGVLLKEEDACDRPSNASIVADTACQGADWRAYDRYFDPTLKGMPA